MASWALVGMLVLSAIGFGPNDEAGDQACSDLRESRRAEGH